MASLLEIICGNIDIGILKTWHKYLSQVKFSIFNTEGEVEAQNCIETLGGINQNVINKIIEVMK